MDQQPITEEMIFRAVVAKMSEDQNLGMSASIWGFMAKALSGPAKTIFEGSDDLNGLDAWRRVIVFISSGKGIQLEDMRRELKFIQLRAIPSLEQVEERIAEFINVHRRYEKIVGSITNDAGNKADLLAILRKAVADNLL